MPDRYTFGLVGYPVEHSLSPRIHMAALKKLRLAGEYNLHPVENPAGLKDLLEQVRLGNIHGLNVTIPYKKEVLPLMDDLTRAARTIGAVNTVFLRDGLLVGDNTDASGFNADLERKGWSQRDMADRNALVLGAGGSARAIVYALLSDGWRVTVAARRTEQAASLNEIVRRSDGKRLSTGEDLGIEVIKLSAISISDLSPKPTLIVNTTPVGMHPQVDGTPWPEGLDFPPQTMLYDLVYNPAVTMMMQNARDQGLQVANGIGMLVEQAALSLEVWTGLNAPRQVMHHAVMEFCSGNK